ncbi:MAG: tetratricopeptide repeat protein [Terriglobales bacterium]
MKQPSPITESQHRMEAVNVGSCCVAGLQALEQGDLQEAMSWAARCGALPEASEDARYAALQGGIAAAKSNFSEAADHFRMAMRLDPHEMGFARQLVEVLQTEGLLEEAVDVLENMIQKDPREADLLIDLGYARLASGNRAGARDALERAATLRPQDKTVLFALAQMYEAIEEPALAVEVLSGNLRDEASPRVLNELARLLLHLQRYADAERIFRALGEKDAAARLVAQHGIIWCRIKREDWRGALTTALDATRLDCYGVTTKFLAYTKDRVFTSLLDAAERESELLQRLCDEMDEYAELHCSEAIGA